MGVLATLGIRYRGRGSLHPDTRCPDASPITLTLSAIPLSSASAAASASWKRGADAPALDRKARLRRRRTGPLRPPVGPRSSQAAIRAALKTSPAPVVSTTGTGNPGTTCTSCLPLSSFEEAEPALAVADRRPPHASGVQVRQPVRERLLPGVGAETAPGSSGRGRPWAATHRRASVAARVLPGRRSRRGDRMRAPVRSGHGAEPRHAMQQWAGRYPEVKQTRARRM